MSINISNVTSSYSYQAEYSSTVKKTESSSSSASDVAAVYEKSSDAVDGVYAEKNAALIEQLKADNQARVDSLVNMVQSAISQQGGFLASADDVWKFLASGDFTVSAETKAAAQEAISEDGYWGVKQTSDRIVEFAKALSGGDVSKAEELKEAFIKGFKQATDTWGKELPQISQDTYDAVIEKFDNWINGTE
ncbi:MAG: hypothetical protein K6G40_03600 [Eubacterium sp.]|nr:hypothetical protein [Eubacterium sp.]